MRVAGSQVPVISRKLDHFDRLTLHDGHPRQMPGRKLGDWIET